MKGRVIDRVKFDTALVPQSINNTNVTGHYFSMNRWKHAAFHCQFGACAANGFVKLEVFQGKTRAGTSGAAITNAVATSALLTGGSVMKVTLATFLATGTITVTPYINGTAQTALVFTSTAGATDVTTRTFKCAVSDTADGDALVVCLNDPTYGVPGFFAVNAAGVVTLYAIDDRSTVKLASAPDNATDVKAIVEGQLLVEVDASAMTWASGFDHLAAKVTVDTATVVCAVSLARFGRWNPVQQAAVAAVSVE